MWKNIKDEEPEIDRSKYLETDYSFNTETISKSKPIIIHAAQSDPWCPYVFYIGYWVEEISEMNEKPSYTQIDKYFSPIDPWEEEKYTSDGRYIDYIGKDNIDYWDYFNGDMPDFE